MNGSYLLKEVRIVNPLNVFDGDIRVRNGHIEEIAPRLMERANEEVLDCAGLLACPGLINSHDHLQFNLYSRIGEPPYANSYEWGNDIRTRWLDIVGTIERIPRRQRYLWGAWKNLFSGVTFVVHHDPFSPHFRFLFPIDVLRRFTFAHSPGNERNMSAALAKREPGVPFILHLAEGTDDITAREVSEMMRRRGLDERTVAVHAINISQQDIETLSTTKSSIVWCPSSNQFLFGKTSPVDLLAGKVPVALGTDSTLTGSISMFDEMRCARRSSNRTPQEIMMMVTEIPRNIFGLRTDIGQILEKGSADFFLLRATETDPYETLLNARPEDISLLMKSGHLVLFDEAVFPSLPKMNSQHSLLFGEKRKTISEKRCVQLFYKLRPFLSHYSYLNGN